MNISDFGLIILNSVYVGILWLIVSSCPETPFSSILHHSNTPTLLDGLLRTAPISLVVAPRTNFFVMKRQTLTVSALPQALPSCREGRDGQFGKI